MEKTQFSTSASVSLFALHMSGFKKYSKFKSPKWCPQISYILSNQQKTGEKLKLENDQSDLSEQLEINKMMNKPFV